MTGSDVAAVIVSITSVVTVVVLVIAVNAITRTLKELRETLEALRTEAQPAIAELHRAAETATHELGRVDGLVDRAESVTATVDSASRLAYLATANPVIKAMAAAEGTRRAARRLRKV